MNNDTRGISASPRLMSVDSLVGNNVHNRQGDNLGDIKDIMLDMHTGHIAYAVLSFEGKTQECTVNITGI